MWAFGPRLETTQFWRLGGINKIMNLQNLSLAKKTSTVMKRENKMASFINLAFSFVFLLNYERSPFCA